MGYNVSIITILIFFISVNVALTWIVASQVLPVDFTDEYGQSPLTSPQNISNMFLSVDLSTGNLILGTVTLVITALVGWAAGNFVLGGTLGVGLFALTIFSPIVSWILLGLPKFLNLMGMPVYISAGLGALVAVPLFFTVMGFITQRPVEGHG